jgi:hypothetical protein
MAEHGQKLTELKAQRDRIDAHFDVTARGARDLAAQQHRDRVEANRKALHDEVEALLADWDRLQAAVRVQVDAINSILARNARMATLARELPPSGKAPMALSRNDLVDRLSGRIASTMMTIPGHPQRFGSVQWPSGAPGLYPANREWRQDEERRITADIRPLIQGKG